MSEFSSEFSTGGLGSQKRLTGLDEELCGMRTAAQPREGLEDRVLTRIRVEQSALRRHAFPRRGMFRSLAFGLAAAGLAGVAVLYPLVQHRSWVVLPSHQPHIAASNAIPAGQNGAAFAAATPRPSAGGATLGTAAARRQPARAISVGPRRGRGTHSATHPPVDPSR